MSQTETAHRRRVTIVCPRVVSSFIKQDERCLGSGFDVQLIPDAGIKGLRAMTRAIKQCDAVLLWFLGRHAIPAIMLAWIYRKLAVTIIEGFDVAWIPELNYGIRPGSIKERVVKGILRTSSGIAVVSQFSRQETHSRFPDLKHRTRLVYNAVDTRIFVPTPAERRSIVISVGAISRETIGRKSWRLFVDAARRMPDISFVIIGAALDQSGRNFLSDLPRNVSWRGAIPMGELISELQSASV